MASPGRKRQTASPWMRLPDGTVVAKRGKIIFFSIKRFVEDVCKGHCCFICGAAPGSRPFNDEHVLPEWVLRKYKLFNQQITLPNGNTVSYRTYKIPCCEHCNSLMGKKIEHPVSKVFAAGPHALEKFIRTRKGALKLFIWLGLIFLKTHLRDRSHRFHLDERKGSGKIADAYDWEHLHHIHTIVRSFFVSSRVHPAVVGSLFVASARPISPDDNFDFADLYLSQTMMIRLNDIAIVTVFNDSCGAMNFFGPRTAKITGPLHKYQIREVMVELSFLNLLLKTRPLYRSSIDPIRKIHWIGVALPAVPKLGNVDLRLRGRLLEHAFKDAIPTFEMRGVSKRQLRSIIKSGQFSVLFDAEGNFAKDSIRIEARP